MRGRLFIHLTFLAILSLTISCVGTVEELKEDTQKSVLDNPYDISFDGVASGVATAHSKVRLFFKPAQGGSGTFSYNAYVNGNYSSAKGSTSTTTPDEDGNLFIDVSGLGIGQNTSILVRAFDIQNNVEDQNNKLLSLTTLPYEVPLFEGVHKVENLAGIDGETKLKVSWIKALPSSSSGGFGSNPNDISGYNIYVGVSKVSLTLVGTVNADITDYILSGLTSESKYYVKVLARNSNVPVQLEDQNVEIKSQTTLSSQPINFVGLKSISIPQTNQGFSKINLSWDQGTGGFDRYRIFVRTDTTTPDPTVDTAHSADITDLSVTSTQVSVANPYTLYYVTIVACDGVSCNDFQGQNVNLPVTTTPPVAPYNGITTLEQAAGQFGLTQLEASWFAPDTTQGVYDTIKLYQTDSIGNDMGEVPLCNGGVNLCYEVVSATKWKLVNMTQGQEYCYMTKAYSTSPFKADEPGGRTHANVSYKCATPSYKEPGFAGPTAGCSAITATGLNVSWSAPVPFGTFEQFELYYKTTSGAFSFAQALAGHIDYTKVSVSSSATTWALASLNPSTTYQIGVKTYLADPDNPGTGFRDSNNNVISCNTLDATATSNGWFNILALGPKVDGRSGSIVPERYLDRDTTVDPPIYIPYPQEFAAGDPSLKWPAATAVSSDGMVVLKWKDYTIDGIGNMYDLKDLHAENGYNVYRKEYVAAHDTLAPDVSDLSNSALATWTKVNDTVIKPRRDTVRSSENSSAMITQDLGLFVDYSVTQSGTLGETKTYWYMVVAVLGGKAVNWSAAPADGLLEVVLPPRNMGLMHRWIANQTMCEILRREVDREKHHRCEYNGLGSTFDASVSKDFYDMGKHVLFSRFVPGVNFTRTESCTDVGGAYHTKTQGDAVFAGFDGDKNLDNIGACIGTSGTPNGYIQALTGTIFFDRYRGYSYMNRSGGDFSNPVLGTDWVRTDGYDGDLFSLSPSSSYFIQNNINPFSLNAHLPSTPLMGWTRNQVACYQNELSHKGTNYKMRLLRKKEQVPLTMYSPYLNRNNSSDSIQYFLEGRMHENESTRLDCIGKYRRDELQNIKTSATNDFTITGDDLYPIYGGVSQSTGQTILTDTLGTTYRYVRSNPAVASGSSGPGSTEMCVSRFGISDPISFDRKITGDSFWVSKSLNGMSTGHIYDETPPYNTTKRTPANDPHLSWDEGIIDDWKSGNGLYYNTMTVSGNNFAETFKNVYTSIHSATGYNTFFNPILGVYLSCKGLSCIKDAAPDDNQLFSMLTSGTTALYKGFNIGPSNERFVIQGYDDSLFSEPNFYMALRYGHHVSHGWDDGILGGEFVSRTNWSRNSSNCAIQVPSYGD